MVFEIIDVEQDAPNFCSPLNHLHNFTIIVTIIEFLFEQLNL